MGKEYIISLCKVSLEAAKKADAAYHMGDKTEGLKLALLATGKAASALMLYLPLAWGARKDSEQTSHLAEVKDWVRMALVASIDVYF